MNHSNCFFLAGQGYLVDVDWTSHSAKAQITFCPDGLTSGEEPVRRDQVILDCEVSAHCAKVLRRYHRRYPVAQGVKVYFKASYECFSACYAEQQPHDSPNILMLKAKLIQLSRWRQDSAALQWIKSSQLGEKQ